MGNRRYGRFVAAALLVLVVAGFAAPAGAQPAPPLPKAYVLVDADTGAIIDQQDARAIHPPASTIKLLTALIAVQHLKPDDPIPISPVAESMPARKINVKAGQVWRFEDLLYSMMMVSANDAAVAIAETLGGGSLDGFVRLADDTAARLGLEDHPILNDPAGLDDEFSNKGGDRISARDLAIISRAVLARRDLVDVINTRDYAFTGGDGIGHTLTNHDLFLDLYPGANGLKTGTTDLAGHTFVGSATRGGRTMLAIVFDAEDYYGSAGRLLDQGFNTPVTAETGLDHLPDVVNDASLPPPAPPPSVAASARPAVTSDRSLVDSSAFAIVVLFVGLVPLVALRRRVVVRADAKRWRAASPDELDDVPDESRPLAGLEQELSRIVFVDVTDEPVVDAVADELL